MRAKRSSTGVSNEGLWLGARHKLCLLGGEQCAWKPCRRIRAANTDRRKHITMRHPHQMGVMATHLSPTPSTGVYVPRCQRRVTKKAFYVGAEQFHRSILLQKLDLRRGASQHKRNGQLADDVDLV